MTYNTIGLLGGTFDPIHEGHLAIAQKVYDALQLIRVEFIPCFVPPHRETPHASAQDRMMMLKLALENHPQFCINPIEFDLKKTSYTVETLQALRKKNSDTVFLFYHWRRCLCANRQLASL